MSFLKPPVMNHASQLASADAGTLLTGDLRESFSDSSDSNSDTSGTDPLFGLQDA